MSIPAYTLLRLQTQHQVIPFLIRDIPEHLLAQRPANGKWSIIEQMAHIGCYQDVFVERMQLIRAGAMPAFERYTAENDPAFGTWRELPSDALWEATLAGRERVLTLLTGLTDSERAHRGSHPLFGAVDIDFWSEFMLLHEAHHLYAIMKLAGEIRVEDRS